MSTLINKCDDVSLIVVEDSCYSPHISWALDGGLENSPVIFSLGREDPRIFLSARRYAKGSGRKRAGHWSMRAARASRARQTGLEMWAINMTGNFMVFFYR